MKEISSAIRLGAKAYLNRQYKTVAIVAVIISIALYFAFGWLSVLGFLVGAFASALAGYIGMNIAVRSNSQNHRGRQKRTCIRPFLWLLKLVQ